LRLIIGAQQSLKSRSGLPEAARSDGIDVGYACWIVWGLAKKRTNYRESISILFDYDKAGFDGMTQGRLVSQK